MMLNPTWFFSPSRIMRALPLENENYEISSPKQIVACAFFSLSHFVDQFTDYLKLVGRRYDITNHPQTFHIPHADGHGPRIKKLDKASDLHGVRPFYAAAHDYWEAAEGHPPGFGEVKKFFEDTPPNCDPRKTCRFGRIFG